MHKNVIKKMSGGLQQKKILATIISFLSLTTWVILSSYSAGPAKSGLAATGAPFNSGNTCALSGCHNGGAFGGAITTKLIDTLTKLTVTAYVPGKAYDLKISLTKTTGKPKYGFQTTAATVAGTNVNKWGKAPASTHNTLLSGHNYCEQSKALKSGIITIPWTGPAKGTGSVIFYTAGNIVDGTGGVTGDQVVNNSLTITEAPTPSPANNIFADPMLANKATYALKLYNQHGSIYVMFHNGSRLQKVQLTYTDVQGNPLISGVTVANEGDNIWPLKTGRTKGLIIGNVVTEDGIRTSLKVMVD